MSYIITRSKTGNDRAAGHSGRKDHLRTTYPTFYGTHDKGSKFPAWTSPKRVEELSDQAKAYKEALDKNQVSSDMRPQVENKYKMISERLGSIVNSWDETQKFVNENEDKLNKRRKELAKEIGDLTPPRQMEKEHRVNPHTVLRREKEPDEKGLTLDDKKSEYILISRALGEESNVGFLQKER